MRQYSTREVAEIARLSEALIRRWARAGIIAPTKNRQGRWCYGFQDLALLRTARKLLDSRVSLNRVTRTLSLLRRQTPLGRPLSAVRILVTGGRVLVKDRFTAWEPTTGQGTLDFEPAALSSNLLPAQLEETAAPRADQDAGTLYSMALDLELSGHTEAAESAYQAVLELEPEHPHARINLGRLLHQQNRFALAEACYRRVLQQDPENALAAFNLGVVLEDQQDGDAALAAYRRTVAIDDSYADAHFNLSRLLEARGEQQAALRHLSRFRRLTKE